MLALDLGYLCHDLFGYVQESLVGDLDMRVYAAAAPFFDQYLFYKLILRLDAVIDFLLQRGLAAPPLPNFTGPLEDFFFSQPSADFLPFFGALFSDYFLLGQFIDGPQFVLCFLLQGGCAAAPCSPDGFCFLADLPPIQCPLGLFQRFVVDADTDPFVP